MSQSEFGISLAEDVANKYLNDIYPKIADTVSQPIEYLCIIYIALLGYKAYNGRLAVQDFLARVVMVAMVFATLEWNGFGGQIYNVFNTFTNKFAQAVFDGGKAETMLESFYDGIFIIGQALLKKAGHFGVGLAIQAIALLVINVLLLAISYAILIFAKLGLAVTMCVCPLFMGFFIFPQTRQWAYNWISMMLNFTFIYVLTMTIIKLSFSAFKTTFNNMNDLSEAGGMGETLKQYTENTADVYGLMLIMSIIIIFLLQVKGWAAALSSGAQIQGIGSAVSRVVSTAMNLKAPGAGSLRRK